MLLYFWVNCILTAEQRVGDLVGLDEGCQSLDQLLFNHSEHAQIEIWPVPTEPAKLCSVSGQLELGL